MFELFCFWMVKIWPYFHKSTWVAIFVCFQKLLSQKHFFESFKWGIIFMDFVGFLFRASKFKNDISYIKYKFSHKVEKVHDHHSSRAPKHVKRKLFCLGLSWNSRAWNSKTSRGVEANFLALAKLLRNLKSYKKRNLNTKIKMKQIFLP